MKIEIKNRFTGDVIFAHEAEGNSISVTVSAALQAGASLKNANLENACTKAGKAEL